MTNKEKYKQAFSVIKPSDECCLEVSKMKKSNRKIKTLVASVAVCAVIGTSASAIYSADIGGIQRKIQLWLNGDQTQATIEFDGKGTYNIHYQDENGEEKTKSGGGVAFNPDGTQRPLTEEELMKEITAPDVKYNEDGSAWLYWFDQKIDITDKFKDNVCYLKLVNGDEILYVTVKYKNGLATSPYRYIQPSEFNTQTSESN